MFLRDNNPTVVCCSLSAHYLQFVLMYKQEHHCALSPVKCWLLVCCAFLVPVSNTFDHLTPIFTRFKLSIQYIFSWCSLNVIHKCSIMLFNNSESLISSVWLLRTPGSVTICQTAPVRALPPGAVDRATGKGWVTCGAGYWSVFVRAVRH